MSAFYVSSNSKDFEPCPAGAHPAWCYGLIDLGTQTEQYQGKTTSARKVVLLFEVPLEKDKEGNPFTVRAKVTASLSDRANLRKWLQSWRGRPFTEEELKKFELSAVVGKGCQLIVIHKPKAGEPNKVSDFIDNILPFPKNTQLPPCSKAKVVFSIDDWDQKVFDSLSKSQQEKIASSPEGKAKLSGKTAQPPAAPQDDDSSIPF